MEILVTYSSITGNTRRVAEAIHSVLPVGAVLTKALPRLELKKYDLVFLGFWVDKSAADSVSAELLKRLHGKKIALFATMGAYPDTPYSEKCMRNAAALLNADNELVGDFHCQGKISNELIEMSESFLSNCPRKMENKYASIHQETSSHPNQSDLLAAAIFAKNVMIQLKENRRNFVF